MKNVSKMFLESAGEFKKINSLTAAALLIAIHTVLAFVMSFQVTASIRISISFLANIVIGAFFGPVMGFVCGGAGDLIQFIVKPTGAFFPGWTLNSAIACMIYGMFFYKKFPKKLFDVKYILRCVIALTFDTLLVNVFLGTLWVSIMYGKGFIFYLSARLFKNMMQLPINIMLTYFTLYFAKNIRHVLSGCLANAQKSVQK